MHFFSSFFYLSRFFYTAASLIEFILYVRKLTQKARKEGDWKMDLQHEFSCSLCVFGQFIVNEQGKYELIPPSSTCSSDDPTANPPALNESRLVLLNQFWILAKKSAEKFDDGPDAPIFENQLEWWVTKGYSRNYDCLFIVNNRLLLKIQPNYKLLSLLSRFKSDSLLVVIAVVVNFI